MAEPPLDRVLMDLWRAGDEAAARKLFDTYVERLVALARRRISQRLAARVDPEDVVQSVFRTFFHRVKEGQFSINDEDDLCKLLMRITVHKTLRQVAFHKAAKRNIGLEVDQGPDPQERLQELLIERTVVTLKYDSLRDDLSALGQHRGRGPSAAGPNRSIPAAFGCGGHGRHE